MKNKIQRILTVSVSLFILVAVCYIGGVFFFPDFFDNHGSYILNEKIRYIKEASLHISGENGSLF